ncbi:UTRA domain-containing protein [Planotetraspora phitsanulokensis]|nr:UTRA domain-containing protein [Planotetraspora phitsanulokensis]
MTARLRVEPDEIRVRGSLKTEPHIQGRNGVRFDHVIEQITARMPTADEAKRLGMPKSTPVLDVCAAVRDPGRCPFAVLAVVLPADRHEREDAYPIG